MMNEFFQEDSIISLLGLPIGDYQLASTMKEKDYNFLNDILNCYSTETINKGIICISLIEMKNLVSKYYGSTPFEKINKKFIKHKVTLKNNKSEGSFPILKNVTLNKDNTLYTLELSKEMYRLLIIFLKKQENLSSELILQLQEATENKQTESERTPLPKIDIRPADYEGKNEEEPQSIYDVIREKLTKKKIEEPHKLLTEFFQVDWIASLFEAPSADYRVSSTMDEMDLNFFHEILDCYTTDSIKNGIITISYNDMEKLVDQYFVSINYEKQFMTTATIEVFTNHKVSIKSDKIEVAFPILKSVTFNKDSKNYSLVLSKKMQELLLNYVSKQSKKRIPQKN